MKLKTQLLITVMLAVLLTPFNVYAQQVITGQVRDASNGETIIGANVTVDGTTRGVSTDLDGNFSIEASSGETLIFSFLGKKTLSVTLGDESSINISLEDDLAALDEVVVTALGVVQKKAALSYSVETVPVQELNQSRVGDVGQQLSGQVAGLSITTNNGSGVSSSRVILRGESSLNINRNQPLIVIDGAIISNEYIGIGADSHTGNLPIDYGNTLTDLNPDDFADVSVLKGPKAAALYGARASNGALVIRTKSGKAKKGLGVTVSTGLSFDVVNQFWDEQFDYGGGGYNSSNGEYNEFRYNWGGSFGARTDGRLISQAVPSNRSPNATPFEQKADREGFFETGLSQNHNVALSFSDDNFFARISLGNLQKQGIVPNTDYKKTNISLRTGYNLSDNLSVDMSGSFISSGSDNLMDIGFASGGLMYSMLWTMKNFDLDDFKDYWLPGQEYQQQNYFLTWGTNPYLIVNENLNAFTHNRVFGNIKTNYKFNDNLSGFVRVSIDNYDDLRTSRRAPGQPAFANGMYREQNVGVSEFNSDFYLTYNKQYDKLGIEANVGGNTFRQSISNKVVQTNNLAIKGVFSLENAADKPAVDQLERRKEINSLYGSVLFNYDEKLYLDLTARNDWSSSLPVDANSFFYPSAGVSAVLSNMLTLPDVISFAKIRTSIAQTGNDTDAGLINRTFVVGQLTGSLSNSTLIPNPDLKPEQTTAFEIGLDLKFIDNRISFSFDYYNNTTKDQILQAPVSQASGASAKLINAGEINTTGIEMLLKLTPFVNQDFRWDVAFNFNQNVAEVVSLADGVESFVIAQGPSGATIEARPGGQMGDIYGRGFQRSPSGDIIYKNEPIVRRDADGNTIQTINRATPQLDSEIKKVGNYNPDFTLGITNNISYKMFNLRVFLDYRHGGDFYTRTGSQLYRSGTVTETLPHRETPFVPDGVVSDGNGGYTPNTTTSPGYDFYRSFYRTENVEANTYDATFLKVREVALGVDLTSFLKDTGFFSGVHLSVFGRNLYTWTKEEFARHFDPEVLTFSGSSYVRGLEIGQLPGAATYGVNLQLNF